MAVSQQPINDQRRNAALLGADLCVLGMLHLSILSMRELPPPSLSFVPVPVTCKFRWGWRRVFQFIFGLARYAPVHVRVALDPFSWHEFLALRTVTNTRSFSLFYG